MNYSSSSPGNYGVSDFDLKFFAVEEIQIVVFCVAGRYQCLDGTFCPFQLQYVPPRHWLVLTCEEAPLCHNPENHSKFNFIRALNYSNTGFESRHYQKKNK
jgi:hypothetical protein